MVPSPKKLVTSRSGRPSPSRSSQATPMPAWYPPVGVAGHAGLEADLLEPEAAEVAEEIIGRAVVGDVEVDPTVVVEVGRDHAQPSPVGDRRSPRPRSRRRTGRRRCGTRDRASARDARVAVEVTSPALGLRQAAGSWRPRRCNDTRKDPGRRRCRGPRMPRMSASLAGRPGRRGVSHPRTSRRRGCDRSAYEPNRVMKRSGWPSLL